MLSVGGSLASAGPQGRVHPMPESTAATEALFRAIFDRSFDAMLIVADDSGVIDGNPAAVALLGVTREALRTMRIADFASDSGRDAVDAAWAQFKLDGTLTGLFTIRRGDGELRMVDYQATADVIPGCHLSILRDVTERHRVDEARATIASVVEAASDAIIGVGPDGCISYWSPACARIFGYTAGEALGMKTRALIPDDVARDFDDVLAAMHRGESRQLRETVRLHKDGRRVPVSATYAPIHKDGRLAGVSVVMRETSDQQRVDEKLALADRLATAGTLAAGIAHEINNPLAALVANLEHIGGATAGDDSLREPVADARSAAIRIREIVRDLRFLANPGDSSPTAIDVRTVLQSTVRIAAQEIRARARLVEDYQPVPTVDANVARLGQILVNLVVNATQAIPEGGADDHEIYVGTRTDGAGRAVVTVRDTGAGIASEHLKRIFDPFFTTRPIGAGAGLGLAISHRLVSQLGGEIRVQSSAGRGSQFEVVLPPSTAAAVPAAPPEPISRSTTRARVLVIDDEPIVGRAVKRVLQVSHDVTAVTSARAALELIAAGERYDLILCDLMMPHMTGMELHEQLTASAPEVAARIVFLTGGAFTPAARSFLDRISNPCFEKPFDAEQLRQLAARSTQ
jgi:PAS domain S-box-containing protein